MSHPYTFTFKHIEFVLEGGRLFFDGHPISFRDFLLFARGKIELAPAPEPEPAPTIVDVVLDVSGTEGLDNDGSDFDILREALTVTGLVDTLADRDADFTVFAPTDAAFIQLARDLGADIADGDEAAALDAILTTLAALAPDGDPVPILKDILLYHVAPEGRSLAELQDGAITTAQGSDLDVRGTDVVDAEPDIANPGIVSADIETANGTIQVIDRVLLPLDLPGNEQPNLVDIAVDNGNFTLLVKALDAAGLTDTVIGLDDVTVFAPTDAAFAQLAIDLGFGGEASDLDGAFNFIVGALSGLAPDGDPIPLLTDILLYHVSAEAKSAAALNEIGTIDTLLAGVTFETEGTELVDNEPDVDNPNIVIPDILGGNGIIQAIDRVLLPIDIPGNTPGEVIEGSHGRDKLIGTDGDDEIFGFNGRDKLFGGDGDDMLFGGKGRDLLAGGAGDDHLTGGKGRDWFDFRELDGHDTVKDFGRGDRLVLNRDDFANAHQVFEALTETDDGLVLSTQTGSITLEGVDEHDLNGHSFIFH